MSTLNLALCTIFSFLPESSRSAVFAVCKQWRASYKYVNPTTAYCCSVLNGDFIFAHVLFELFREQIISSTTTRYISCKLNNVQHFAHFASLTSSSVPSTQVSQTERFGLLRIAISNLNAVLVEAIENVNFPKSNRELDSFITNVICDKLYNTKHKQTSIDSLFWEFLKWLLLNRRVYQNDVLSSIVTFYEEGKPKLAQREDLSDFCTFMTDNSLFGFWDEDELKLIFSQRNQRAFDLFCKDLAPESELVYTSFIIVILYIDGNESKMEHLLTLGTDAVKRAAVIKTCFRLGYYSVASTLAVTYHFPIDLISSNMIAQRLNDKRYETFVLHWINCNSRQNYLDSFGDLFVAACRFSCDRVVAKLLEIHPNQCVLGDRAGEHCSPAVVIVLLDHPNLIGLQSWIRDLLDSALLNGNQSLANAILNHPNFLQ